MSAVSSLGAVPEGYTFIDGDTFVSKKSWKIANKLLEKESKRDPNSDDLSGDRLLHLIDTALRSIHNKITAQNPQWRAALYEIEALAIFMDFRPEWAGINDGKRFSATEESSSPTTDDNPTNQVFGACLVTAFGGLKKEGKFNVENIPNLENLLRLIADCAGHLDEVPYVLFCKAAAKRFFDADWEGLKARQKARVQTWKQSLSEQERADFVDDDGDEEEDELDDSDDEEGRSGKWFAGANPEDENYEREEFDIRKIWPRYEEYTGSLRRHQSEDKDDIRGNITQWAERGSSK
jgi:hypothetical protein